MKKAIVLLLTVLILSSCRTNAQEDKRRRLINNFIAAVNINDTTRLYELLDTNNTFKILEKEGFLFEINYVNGRFKECGNNVMDSGIKINEFSSYSKQYVLPFCRGKNGEIIYDSFDLLFTFSEYDVDEKIQFFNVKKYRLLDVKPTTAPPNPR